MLCHINDAYFLDPAPRGSGEYYAELKKLNDFEATQKVRAFWIAVPGRPKRKLRSGLVVEGR